MHDTSAETASSAARSDTVTGDTVARDTAVRDAVDLETSARGESCGGDSTYDYEGTLERLGGDAELFVDLVRFFLDDAAELLAKMETALDMKDARTVEISAHSLKGLCSNFGARRAVAAAYAIEESARAGKLGDAPQSCAQFKVAVAQLTEALRHRLPAE
jgi:HPt (histidine-containing phosphotransfer) domain-containing protein